MQEISFELIKRLPKVELHCHLDGSLRINTILDIAKQKKVQLPTYNPNELFKLISLDKQKVSLEDYIDRFDLTLSVLQDDDSLERVSYELIEDLAKDNICYAEIRFSPILHTKKEMTIDDALNAVKKGLNKGEKEYGIKSGIIICGIRSIDPSVSIDLAELAVKYKTMVSLVLIWPEQSIIIQQKNIKKRFI